MSVFEVMMLVCFGISWPISIAKALRTKKVEGKSPVFMIVICVGYLSGILHKLFFAYDWVIVLYAINMIMVATDLFLYYRYLPSAGGIWRVLAKRVSSKE
jgi:hypothetical protein